MPVAEASPCVAIKGGAVAAKKVSAKSTETRKGEAAQTPPREILWNVAASRRAERMRHVRAAERRCTAAVRVKHRLTAYGTCPHPARPVLSLNAKQAASEVANGDGIIISKPTFRLARGRGGGETPPVPTPSRIQYFVAGIFSNPSSSVAQTVEEP